MSNDKIELVNVKIVQHQPKKRKANTLYIVLDNITKDLDIDFKDKKKK